MRFITAKQNQNDYLAHHGIKGQKWGVRRYQNEDGTLTEAGKRRYGAGVDRFAKEIDKVSIGQKDKNPNAGYYHALMRIKFDSAPRGIKRFNRDSKEYKELLRAAKEYQKTNADFNKEVYKQLKKDGYDTKKLNAKYMEKDYAEWLKLYTKGQEYSLRLFESNPKYLSSYNNYRDASSRYQSKVEDFINSLDYESLNRPLSGSTNISVNPKTGKTYKTPVKSAISVGMLISAGGRLNEDGRKPGSKVNK